MSPLKQALHFVTGNKSAWFIVGVHASDEMQPNVAGWLEVTCVSSEVIKSHQVHRSKYFRVAGSGKVSGPGCRDCGAPTPHTLTRIVRFRDHTKVI